MCTIGDLDEDDDGHVFYAAWLSSLTTSRQELNTICYKNSQISASLFCNKEYIMLAVQTACSHTS